MFGQTHFRATLITHYTHYTYITLTLPHHLWSVIYFVNRNVLCMRLAFFSFYKKKVKQSTVSKCIEEIAY